MAYIVTRRSGASTYYLEVQGYRENGKVKQRVLRYFGTTDPRKDPAARPITKKSVVATYRFGDVALLYHVAKKINMIEVINRYVSKRQGLSLGLQVFLMVCHRLLDDKPSSSNLVRWVKTTHLPFLLQFDPERLTLNTQVYTMDKIYDEQHNIDHMLRIAHDLYLNAQRLLGKEEHTYFYDITSTYFEGKCCPIARLGYSRDGAIDKLQINIGMVVNGVYGLPMMTKVFEGNINDATTVYEMVYYAKFILQKKKGLLIMDRGMDSEENIRIMDTAKYDYIIGLRGTHAFVEELKSNTDPATNDWDTFKNNDVTIQLKKFSKNLFGKRRIVLLYYNPKMAQEQQEHRAHRIEQIERALKDARKLTIEKAKEIIKGMSAYFVLTPSSDGVQWRINQVALNQADRKSGKFSLITNKNISPKEIYPLYFSKDKVEKGFRHLKQDIALHPTRKRLTDRVRVDVFLCHLAYLLLVSTEQLIHQEKIDVFWDGLSSETKEIRLLEYRDMKGQTDFQIVTNTQIQKNIVDKIGLSKYLPMVTTNQKMSS